MENNLFDFATKELSQDAFICWCLNWYNDPTAKLYPMAAEILTLLGEETLPANQKLEIWQQIKKIDILVNLKGQNRVLILEDKTTSSEHDDQIAMYRQEIQSLSPEDQKMLGIDSSVDIRTIYFKTGFHYDYDLATVADIKVDGPVFFRILEKYNDISEILDSYIIHLRGKIAWYQEYGQYEKLEPLDNFWAWNITSHHIAQHNLMRGLLRERFPESMWILDDERYKIRIGTNRGGRPWTQMTIAIPAYPYSDDRCYLFWRIDTDKNGPYISLRLYEWFEKGDQDKKSRHARAYTLFRKETEKLLTSHPEIGLDWNEVKGGYTGGYYESTLLTIYLTEPLKDWPNKADTIKSQVLAVTDHFHGASADKILRGEDDKL